MSQVSPTLPAPLTPELPPLTLDWDSQANPPVSPCGLPLDPIDPTIVVGGAGQAELSGFEDDEEVGGVEDLPDVEDDDEFDDFDDIDEDDFDDDFDDDFEEELDDDYEIEIEDEISAEFGLSGIDVEIDDIDDIEAIDIDPTIEIDPLDGAGEAE